MSPAACLDIMHCNFIQLSSLLLFFFLLYIVAAAEADQIQHLNEDLVMLDCNSCVILFKRIQR